ncbi:MAG TPA: LysR substrate-binding domain-containing protein [Magnetospirillaceae bacterium]|jgi:DNA-binding transcriptional LysR family regulator
MRNLPSVDEMAAFALVAERRSFGKAATELGVSRSALSHAMRALEERLGVRLLNRTTRSVAPTEAGERLLARLRPALDEIGAAVEEIDNLRDTPAGSLRLTVLPLAAETIVAPMLARFMATYPAIRMEISADGALRDIVRDRFDAGIRPGERIERDMVVVPVGAPFHFVICASPDYLERHGTPKVPRDLLSHDCIRLRLPSSGGFLPWRFARGDDTFEVPVDGRLIVNDSRLMVQATVDGVGIGYMAREMQQELIAEGKLVTLFDEWMPKPAGLFLYYPSRRQLPTPLRAFIDFLKAERRGAA